MEESIQSITESDKVELTKLKYSFVKKIGVGTFSKVYLCNYLGSNGSSGQIACKIVNLVSTSRAYAKQFTERELQVLKLIEHKHIISVQSIFQHHRKYFIFMRYAENGDLGEFINEYGPISENQTRVWANQIALAVEYLHSINLAHRDLKADNVLVTKNFNMKLTDFSFTRSTVNSSNETILCKTYCGSYLYAPPEILSNNPYNGKIADLWSFGCIIYSLIYKLLPFKNVHVLSLYKAQIDNKWEFRANIVEISEDLKEVFKNLIEPDVTKRWTIQEFLNSQWITTVYSYREKHMKNIDQEMRSLNISS